MTQTVSRLVSWTTSSNETQTIDRTDSTKTTARVGVYKLWYASDVVSIIAVVLVDVVEVDYAAAAASAASSLVKKSVRERVTWWSRASSWGWTLL